MPHKVVKKKVVAKKKRKDEIAEVMSPKAQKALERELKAHVKEMSARADERSAWVADILAANDDEIGVILDTMVDQLRKMEGPPKLVYEGKVYNEVDGETTELAHIQEQNFAWIAMRCLVACAEWGIRIGNFKLPADKCARCGVRVKPARKKKRG